jgi:alkylation response protein AidB-like acyl-CoA dehydrogenase
MKSNVNNAGGQQFDIATSLDGTSLAAASGASATKRIIDFIRRYTSNVLNSRLMDERRSLPPSLVSDFADAGILGLQVPRQYKGQALSHVDTARIFIQLGAIDANLCVLAVVHNTLGIPPIQQFATEDVRRDVLPRLAQGHSLVTSAISEPGAGSHVRAITTRATKLADGYSITGTKTWISLGGDARYCNVFAQLTDDQGYDAGITGFLVDTHSPGFHIGEEMLTLGLRAVPQYELAFTDLRVPEMSLLGDEGDGLRVAKTAFMAGRVVLAAGSMGAAMRSLELAHRFAIRRDVAPGRLSDNGRIRQILNDAAAAIQAVQTLILQISSWRDAGEAVADDWYFCAKILGCELTWQVVDKSVQILAARGYLDTNIVGQHFRDYRLFRIFEGATEAITVYLGTITKSSQHVLTLIERCDPPPEIWGLAEQVAEVIRGRPTEDAAHQHIHANLVGDLVCWTMLATLTSKVADRSAMHAYTAAWCQRQLRDRLYTGNQELANDLPSATELTQHLADYEVMIGDIGQRRRGERSDVDPLLLRW